MSVKSAKLTNFITRWPEFAVQSSLKENDKTPEIIVLRRGNVVIRVSDWVR